MLREIFATRQTNPNIRKRWFTCPEMDLYVWLINDIPTRFQLSYNKLENEHVINWNRDTGFSHNRIDSGEEGASLKYKMSSILLPDGNFDVSATTRKFQQASEKVDKSIAAFIYARLREYPVHHAKPLNVAPAPEDL
jgi:hypothetical protein